MLYLKLVSLICIAAVGMAGVLRQMQMHQQNSYFISRYLKWLKGNISAFAVFKAAVAAALIIAFITGKYIVLTVMSAVFAVVAIIKAINVQKKSIKKLVFTKRIIRTYLAAGLTLAALIALCLIFEDAQVYLFSLLCIICVYSALLSLVCSVLVLPIERAYTKYYIGDAKRILKSFNNLTVIGVTGSFGKTSFKFILNRILSEKYNTVATPQSFNTPMGVVRTIREKLAPQTQIFICEMGAKNVGDIKEICDIVNPDMAVITAVGEQHLETFKTVENVCKTKFELYDACKNNGGTVFANGNNTHILNRAKAGDKLYLYSAENGGDCFADNISYSKHGASFTVNIDGVKIPVTTKLLGSHNVINITGAVAVAYSLGVGAKDIAFAVSRLEPTEHRLQLKPFTAGSVLIDDAYNANPEGCLEAVKVLSFFDNMQKVIITPGLVELGEKEYDANYALGLAAAKYCDIIILVGINRSAPLKAAAVDSGFSEDKLFVVKSFSEALQIYNNLANKNTVVLFENDLPDNYLK